MIFIKRYFQTLLAAAASVSAQAGVFNSDFNTGALPPGTHTNANVNGGAYLELTGGVGDSGCLKLTKNINGQQGSFILDDLDAGNPIYGFDVTFKVRIGGGTGTPADGLSLCVGPGLADTSNFGEGGAGGGLIFAWDIYNNPDTPPAPRINVVTPAGQVAYEGYSIAGITTTGDVTTWWTDVHIRLNPDGSLTLDYKGENVFTNFFIPGYQALVDAGLPLRFGLGARTGGLNANQWVDNLQITTFTQPMVGISQQPFSQIIQQGNDAAFDVRVANTNGVTYQWYSNNIALAGEVFPGLIITNVQPVFSGSQYKVIATGPNNSATSSVVTLTVTNLTLPAAQLSFNFNDGLTPPEVLLGGTAIVDTTGGVANSGVVKLVAPAGSGTMIVTNSAEAGLPVFGFTARFKLLVGGGTVPPADGFAFAFGNDIPDAPTGDFETGVGLGNGLRVTFDIYDNSGIFGFPGGEGAQPAPSIDVRLGNQVLGTVKLPISFMETGINDDLTPRYQDTIIQLNTDGTINVVYHGALVFDHLPVPGFTSITGGRFAIAARTGGLNANIWVDDFQLTSVTTPGDIRITTQPVSQTILINHALTNTVAVNDATGVTFQWLRNGTNIPGAILSSYVLSPVTLADSGSTFSVQATKAGNTVTSSVVTLTVADLTAPVSPNLTFNFNDGLLPVGTAIYGAGGGGTITPNGGVGDSGVLHITDAVNGQQGAFVISNLYNGAQVSAIAASFDVRLGGHTAPPPADGFSFNFANNLTAGVAGGNEGNGNGLSICFDIYDNGNETPPAPSIDVKYKGAVIGSTQIPWQQLDTGADFRTVLLRVDLDGKLYLSFGERVLHNGLQLPNYTFTAAGRFGFYGNTGGLNENQWIDNILIKGTQSSGPLAVLTQPANATVIAGSTANFSVTLSDPNGATYQWQKQSPGGAFTNIPGATASSYTTPPTTLADSGALFRVNATGPSGSTASTNASLTVVAPITVNNPIATYNFNDCLQPPDTFLNGNPPAYIACSGGLADSGVLHLTDNVNGQQGSFLMPDFNANAPVSAFTVSMRVRIADGTGTPADGISFCWGSSNSIPDTANFGEGGQGDGLVVGLITYAGRADGPSFYVTYRGNNLFQRLVPYSALFTGDLNADPLQQYATLAIRVNANGTLDLQYKGNAILNALPLPGHTPISGARFGLGARTGGENETHWIDDIAIATTVSVVGPTLGFSRTGNDLNLTWGAGYKLQSTPSLNPANWQDVSGATSPYVTPMTGNARFFRLVTGP